MPAALTSGFGPPSKASPSDENGAASPRPAFASNAAAPTARVTGIARRSAARTASASFADRPEDRDLDRAVGSERAGRQRAVDEHGAGTGRDHLAHGLRRRRPAREEHGRASDPAVPVASKSRVRPPAAPTTAGAARVSATTGAETERPGATTPPSGWSPETSTRSPASRSTWPGRASTPRVDRAGRESGGRAARPADAAVRRPRRPVVAGGGDDERVERRGSRRGGGERAVRERGERLHHADESHAGGIVRIAVLVRIDRELDPGEELIRPAVDGDPAGGVRLPAGDSDRQQRRARGDALEAGRAARADDEARHLGAVALGPAGRRRVLTGARVAAGIEHVEPAQERIADVRVDDGRHPCRAARP